MLLKILKYGQRRCCLLLLLLPCRARAVHSSIVKNEAADYAFRSNESQEYLLHGAVKNLGRANRQQRRLAHVWLG